MFNHSNYYILSIGKKLLTFQAISRNIDNALAKSSASDCSRYITVTQARHYQSVLFLCLKYSLQLYGGLCGGRKSAISVSSTATHAVCHLYCSKGGRFLKLITGGYHA